MILDVAGEVVQEHLPDMDRRDYMYHSRDDWMVFGRECYLLRAGRSG